MPLINAPAYTRDSSMDGRCVQGVGRPCAQGPPVDSSAGHGRDIRTIFTSTPCLLKRLHSIQVPKAIQQALSQKDHHSWRCQVPAGLPVRFLFFMLDTVPQQQLTVRNYAGVLMSLSTQGLTMQVGLAMAMVARRSWH